VNHNVPTTSWDIGGRFHHDGILLLNKEKIDLRISSNQRWCTEDELIDELQGTHAAIADEGHI
jgi:hypothetical protein